MSSKSVNVVKWSEETDQYYQDAVNFAESMDDGATIIATDMDFEEVQQLGLVLTDGLNFRAEPHKYAEVIKVLSKNTPVFAELPFKRTEWVQVTTVEGEVGYVMSQYVNWV